MALIKCKMCGGDLNVTEGLSVAECEYCGSRQTIPSVDNEKKMTLFNRASRLLRGCEFDKAAGIFESIVADFPEEAEAYWGLVLCKYGIEYVDDPATGKKVPTCHRSSFESVLDDENLEQACENADSVARRLYRDEAKQIEELRRGIVAVSANEQPYDIFICYKETDEAGDRTLDSVIAQDIYKELTNEGYRVFFSRISLEDKLGIEYEPYIFAALNSAKLMLVVGTDYDYFNAVWVKNEWSRFLKLMTQDKSKHLIPVFKNIDAYDMPKEFAKLSAQDMGKVGAMQDLVRGVEKLIGAKKEEKKETVVVRESSGGPNIAALLKRGEMALQDGKWKDAKSYYDRVLDMDAECAEAYLGLFLVGEQCADTDAFVEERMDALKSCETEKLVACPEETERINAVIKANTLENFLFEGDLRQLFDFDRSYESSLSGRQTQLEYEEHFFTENKNMIRADKFSTGETKARISRMRNSILPHAQRLLDEANSADEARIAEIKAAYMNHLAQAEEKAKLLHEKALEDKKDAIYSKASGLMGSEDETKILEAKRLFESIPAWKKADKFAAQCDKRIEEVRLAAQKKAEEAEKKRLAEEKAKADKKRKSKCITTAISVFAVVAITAAFFITQVIIPSKKYEEAELLFAEKKYEEAAILYEELGKYKDSAEKLIDARCIPDYEKALAYMNSAKYADASEKLTALGDYRDSADLLMECDYQQAISLLAYGENVNYSNIQLAYELFESLGEYKDSSTYLSQFRVVQLHCTTKISKSSFEEDYWYDENGELIVKPEDGDIFDEEGRKTFDKSTRHSYEYNEAGLLVRDNVPTAEGYLNYTEYEYDEQGKLIFKVHNITTPSLSHVYNTDYHYSGDDLVREICSLNGEPYFFINYVYEKGKLIEKSEDYTDYPDSKTVYEYYPDGSLARTITESGKYEIIESFFYDAWGNVTEKTCRGTSGTSDSDTKYECGYIWAPKWQEIKEA